MPTFETRLRAAVLVVTAVTAWTMLIAEARRDDSSGTRVASARQEAIATWCSTPPQVD
jgi:hypothetical protein